MLRLKLTWNNAGMPHGFVCETPVHIVYRLAGCLPVKVIKALTDELIEQLVVLRKMSPVPEAQIEAVQEKFLLAYDDLLDAQDQSRYILHDAVAAEAVLESWRFLHAQRRCRVHVVLIMGNHVHVILSGWPGVPDLPLGELMKRHKTFTNATLKRLGFAPPAEHESVWARGFFDRYVRPGTYEIVWAYVLDNPTKARLVRTRGEWPHLWFGQ